MAYLNVIPDAKHRKTRLMAKLSSSQDENDQSIHSKKAISPACLPFTCPSPLWKLSLHSHTTVAVSPHPQWPTISVRQQWYWEFLGMSLPGAVKPYYLTERLVTNAFFRLTYDQKGELQRNRGCSNKSRIPNWAGHGGQSPPRPAIFVLSKPCPSFLST